MVTSWSRILRTTLMSFGCRVHWPACMQARLAFSKISNRYASAPLRRAWMASMVNLTLIRSNASSWISLAKGAKGKMSSKVDCIFLISWRAVSIFGERSGVFAGRLRVLASLNSFLGHFWAAVGNLGLAGAGGVLVSITVSLVTPTASASTGGQASSRVSSVVDETAPSIGSMTRALGSAMGRSSTTPSLKGLLGGVCNTGKGLQGVESWVSMLWSISWVSPIVGVAGERGGVSTTGTGQLEFNRSTKFETSGKEGTEGVKSLHSAGSSLVSEGTLLTANLPILTFRCDP